MTTGPDAAAGRIWPWIGTSAVSVLMLVALFGVVLASPLPVVPNLHLVAGIAFSTVGAAVILHRRDHTIGRLLVILGGDYAISSTVVVYSWLGVDGHVTAGVDFALWSSGLAGYIGVLILLPWLVAAFPSGRVTSVTIRHVLKANAAMWLLVAIFGLLAPVPVNEIFFDDTVVNPWHLSALGPFVGVVEDLTLLLFVVVLALVAVDLVRRWRGSDGVERLQMRWMGVGGTLCALLVVAAAAMKVLGDGSQLMWVVAIGVGFGALPTAIGLAVVRYRLYDIDRLVSRTITYGIVVGLLVAAYVGGVLLLGTVLPLEGDAAVAISTLAAAAAFAPLRRRVQIRVDQRFSRSHYDAARVIDGFAARLRHEVDLDTLHRDLLDVVARTMEPNRAGLWLADGRGSPQAAYPRGT